MSTVTTPTTTAAAQDELRELLCAFNETTERLRATHLELQQKVASLQEELAEANARLRRSRALAALGEMAAGIAHEVRNPLGSIQLYAQLLAEELQGQESPRELCLKITRAVDGLDGIVRDVLLFAKDMIIRPVPTSTDEIIRRALTTTEAMIVSGEIELVRPDDDSDLELVTDVCLVTQALSNVMRNAIDAMQGRDRRRLRLETTCRKLRCPDGRRRERIVLSVGDTGPGIPPEVVERMFNPFFTTRATGTGLGLAIVHRIVDAHGGHVLVENRPGEGATVRICLPSEPPKDAAKSARLLPSSADEAMEVARDVRRNLVMETER